MPVHYFYLCQFMCSKLNIYIMHIIEISETAIDEWPPLNQSGIYQNLDGGFPLAIFNKVMDTAVVLSPATTFMSAAQSNFKDPQTGDTTLTFGPLGSIVEVS